MSGYDDRDDHELPNDRRGGNAMLILGALTAVIGVLMVVWPNASITLLLCWGVVLIAGCRMVKRGSLLLVIATGLLLFFFGQTLSSFLVLVLLITPVLVTAIILNSGQTYAFLRRLAMALAVAAALFYCGMALAGTDEADYDAFMAEMEAEIAASIDAPEMRDFWNTYAEQGVDTAALRESMRQAVQVMVGLVPAMLALLFIAFTMFCLMLGRMLLQRREPWALNKFPFRYEVMPRWMTALLLAGIALALLGGDDKGWAFYVGANLTLLLLPLAVYFGLAAFSDRAHRLSSPAQTLAFVVLALLTVLLAPLVLAALLLLAVIRSAFHKKIDYELLYDDDDDEDGNADADDGEFDNEEEENR